jgi:Flp pilus assembly protein CpaB
MDEVALRAAAARVIAALGGPRRVAAAALIAVAVLAALRVLSPAPAPTIAVWAAAHDLAGGRPLGATDVARLALPVAAVPAGALSATTPVIGRLLAAPMRQGEPLTDVRLLGPSLLAALAQPGLVAVPIRVADGSAAAAVVKPGDLVDVLEVVDPTAGESGGPRTVATRIQVLSVPGPGDAGDGGGLVVLAATTSQARALAQASAGSRLTLTVERP